MSIESTIIPPNIRFTGILTEISSLVCVMYCPIPLAMSVAIPLAALAAVFPIPVSKELGAAAIAAAPAAFLRKPRLLGFSGSPASNNVSLFTNVLISCGFILILYVV